MDMKKKMYEFLEGLGTDEATEIKASFKEWATKLDEKTTDAVAEKNALTKQIDELKGKIGDADSLKAKIAELEEKAKGAPTDERVAKLEATLEKERAESKKAIEEAQGKVTSLQKDFLTTRVRAEYSKALNLEDEVQEMVLDRVIGSTEFTESDGVFYHVAKDGTTVPHGDHIKSIAEQYAKFNKVKTGGNPSDPNTNPTAPKDATIADKAREHLKAANAIPMIDNAPTL